MAPLSAPPPRRRARRRTPRRHGRPSVGTTCAAEGRGASVDPGHSLLGIHDGAHSARPGARRANGCRSGGHGATGRTAAARRPPSAEAVTMPTASNGSAGAAERLRRVALPAVAALPLPARRVVLHALGRYAPWEDGFDFSAPALGEGEVAGPPDFVGIGAQKSGTTWWYELIATHPDVACRDIFKERHFFGRFATRPFDGGGRRDVPRVVPAPGGPDHGRVDAGLPAPALGSAVVGEVGARRATAPAGPRPGGALPLRPRPPPAPRRAAHGRGPRRGAGARPVRPVPRTMAGARSPRPGPRPPVRTVRGRPERRARADLLPRALPLQPAGLAHPRRAHRASWCRSTSRYAAGWPTSTRRTSACCRRSLPTST